MPSSSIQLAAFALRLRNLRQAYATAIDLPDLAPAEFARMLGVESASYEAYEQGEREPPLSVLALLHQKTGVSLDWLIADENAGSRAGGSADRSLSASAPPPG
ncbi:MAG: helix-turn-helix domain-containing protein [Alphaproteobacteria bacterium]|nr:helix-turn-helix domain-containing protein [Alphaproteobacteria bacterium]